jgi:hypothetical protein
MKCCMDVLLLLPRVMSLVTDYMHGVILCSIKMWEIVSVLSLFESNEQEKFKCSSYCGMVYCIVLLSVNLYTLLRKINNTM